MTTIDVYASQVNYWRHLAPVVDELRARGHDVATWSPPKAQSWGPPLGKRRIRASVAVCASYLDARRLLPQRVIYVEHGAGQTYVEGTGIGYAGADDLEHVVLFVAPGEHVAARWRACYPQVPVETVGCLALDQHLHDFHTPDSGVRNPDDRPLVVISQHWRCGVCPETMPAGPDFERGIRELARLGDIQLLGHAHPRGARLTAQWWREWGVVDFEPDPDVVLSRLVATRGLLVHDNSSLMYEAAALDVPVLALNAPTYRRDVEHGLRFWSHVPGLQCDSVGTFIPAVIAALDDPPEAKALRARAASHVYAHRDGGAAARAADAIERVL